MAQTTPPTITPAPTAPQRGVKATFSTLVDAFVTWLVTAVTQFGAVATNVYNNAVDAFNSATAAAGSAITASGYATNAQTSATAAAAASGAPAWVSGTTYTAGQVVYSPVDFRSYRRKTAGAGTTDPSVDSTNWLLVSNGPVPTIYVREEASSGTGSGSAPSAGVWVTRVLNTVKTNTINGASLAANAVTLPAGTYKFVGSAPAYQAQSHKAQLYNSTDASLISEGSSEYTSVADQVSNRSFLRGTFTLASTKTIVLQHRVSGSSASFGVAATTGIAEMYSELFIEKVG